MIPRRWCFEVNERLDSKGNILSALDNNELALLVEKIENAGFEAVAVCLLFSYLNPLHEITIGRYLEKKLGIPVTLSSEILPEFREFERCSTTLINAYLINKVGEYLTELKKTMKQAGLKK